MLINADFSRPAIVAARDYHWVESPQQGVQRVMLDRVGAEQARATSIVRYAPDSFFPRHQHPGGEEILVLSGTFSDELGHYPAGWYLRNPPGSNHQPFSVEGAVIFVKLRQMTPAQDRQLRIDTGDPSRWQRQGGRDVCPLFADGTEQVSLQRLAPGEQLFAGPVHGAELLIVDGSLEEEALRYEAGSWIRLPKGEYPAIAAGAAGATLYLKMGQLPDTVSS
jgi:anti-sigma factor ChrR (cupin superfamily)